MSVPLSPFERWSDRIVIGDRVLSVPIDTGIVTEDKIKAVRGWINQNKNLYLPTYAVMYHSTDKNIPILEQGIKPTTHNRRRSYQSESGYVYLANTAEKAKIYGDLGNMSNACVYEVIVPIRTLLPDKDLLDNQRSVGVIVGNSLAESICYGGARVKGRIEPWQIKEYQVEITKPRKAVENLKTKITDDLLKLFESKLSDMGYEIRERHEHEKYGTLKDVYLANEKVATIIESGLGFPQTPHLENEQNKLTDFFNRLREMYYLHKDGTPLPYNEITDYRMVSSFGESLLAVKLNSNNDFCFTTWDYDYERKGVCYGHYFETNYEGAKQDFLYRSGLVEKNKELKHDEIAIIYDSLVYRGVNDNDITFEDEQLLNKTIEKIEEELPTHITENREQVQEIER